MQMVVSFTGWRGNEENLAEETPRLPVVGRKGTGGEQVRPGKPKFRPGGLPSCKLLAPWVWSLELEERMELTVELDSVVP